MKKSKLRTFWGWEVQTQKITIMIFILTHKNNELIYTYYVNQAPQPAQKRFKNVASTLVFTLCERFWNVIFEKFIQR